MWWNTNPVCNFFQVFTHLMPLQAQMLAHYSQECSISHQWHRHMERLLELSRTWFWSKLFFHMFNFLRRKYRGQAYVFMFNISETILNPTEVTGTCIKRRKTPNTSAGLKAVFQMSLSCVFLTKTGQLSGYVGNKAVVHWDNALPEANRNMWDEKWELKDTAGR